VTRSNGWIGRRRVDFIVKEKVMTEYYKYERGTESFWLNFGFTKDAAKVAANCFPEATYRRYCQLYFLGMGCEFRAKVASESDARLAAQTAPLSYRTDARHPAFWFEQGYDWDEMAARAVAANVMVKLQREAAPPPPPSKTDRIAEMTQALLLQGALQRQIEGPGNASQSEEPFDPDDYPRFRAAGR